MEQIAAIILKYGGFVQHSSLDRISFRVPPEHFDAALNEAASLGEVFERDVRTKDVTDSYFDTQLRLEVAEQSRQRLSELLRNAAAVKDVLEVERDIRRLTEEIEGMKGALRLMRDQIDLATITVSLEERVVVEAKARTIPRRFGWMAGTGIEQVMRETPPYAPIDGGPGLWRLVHGRPFSVELPAAFVTLLHSAREQIASSAEDYRLRLVARETPEQAELAYWSEALRHELATNRGYSVQAPEPAALRDKALTGQRMRSRAFFGGEAWVYDVWLIQRKTEPGQLLVVEFAALEKDAATLRTQADAVIEQIKFPIARALWRGI